MPWEILQQSTDVVAIHAALLATSPDGDILLFGDWKDVTPDAAGATHCRIYHMTTRTVEGFANADRPSTNAFCGGHAFMNRGLLLVAGGTVRRPSTTAHDVHDDAGHWDGEQASWIYEPDDKRWVRTADLHFQPGSTTKGGGRWYPMLVALSDGQVLAIGGHPSNTDDYSAPGAGAGVRHNNNTPERYGRSPRGWTLITSAVTAPNGVVTDAYPRYRLLPNGLLFTSTQGMGTKRMYDAATGQWAGPDVNANALPADYARGSATTSVLLPLLSPSYAARVLAMSSPHQTSFLIEINALPAWRAAPARQGAAAGKARYDACAVLLPTGQVLLTGGTEPVSPTSANPIREPELYTPAIDWATGAFTGDGQWTTLNEPAGVARPYHSVALLLPDGRVWTAGGTQAWSGLAAAETRVELFSPWYVGMPRPRIREVRRTGIVRRPPALAARRIGYDYGETFRVRVDGTISRVALLRCGSVTHAYDSDQRYVGLAFSQQGDTLAVTAPPNGSVAPPGYYMLWVIDDAGVPCERAAFVHVPSFRRLPRKRRIVAKRSMRTNPKVVVKRPKRPKPKVPGMRPARPKPKVPGRRPKRPTHPTRPGRRPR